MDEGIAVIVAAIMAILGIFYSGRQQRKMLRKQHTFQVIEKLNGSKELDKHVDYASKMLKTNTVPRLCDENNEADCEKIDFLLNYYEFLACAVVSGDIDEELVRLMERSRLCRSYLQFIPYIEENRQERGSDQLWENLEFIAYRWLLPKPDPFDGLVSVFLMRPAIGTYYLKREEISAFLHRERAKL